MNEIDLERDRFDVTYDDRLVTPARILATIQKEGFRATLVEGGSSSGSTPASSATPAPRRDLSALPAALRRRVEQAREEKKPLLLAFHAPG